MNLFFFIIKDNFLIYLPFRLLGLNGAGKTTTFKILTGELDATSGNAFINGHDIDKNKFEARRNLGLCPQSDYLPEFLSVEQSFRLFANLRGLESDKIKEISDDLIQIFRLNESRTKQVQQLSGGTKRKVSAAIAFIGRPSCVILDEPTTGMDPAARRYLWTVIIKARDLGMTIVLTTHSMEESEILSTRLGIMVNGQFKCLGSVQHLKSKYGRGYTLIIKCKQAIDDDDAVDRCVRFVKEKIRYSLLKDRQQDTLFYQIESPSISVDNSELAYNNELQSIGELFDLIESNKEELNIETYSLSQTTLEQIFLMFADDQKNQEENNIVDSTDL